MAGFDARLKAQASKISLDRTGLLMEDLRHCRAGLRWRDLDVAALEAGPDPFQKFALRAPDRHWGTIQTGQWPDTTGFLEANAEPLAPVRKQGQAVEICDGPQNQIGRIAFDDDASLVTFSTELRGDHHQVAHWTLPSGYVQRPAMHRGALAKLDHIRFQILAADPYRFLSKYRRPESGDLDVGTERRKQMPG